jgi:hypothetical protein
MADIAKLQAKRNKLFLAPKRKLTSVIAPTTVDTTPTAPVTDVGSYTSPSSINTSAGSGTSIIAPTTTTTPTTTPTAPAAPKTNPTTDALKKAAIVGGVALAGKALLDKYGNPVATTPASKPATSVVAPAPSQDAEVKAAIAAKNAADHEALVGSMGDQGTKVGLPENTIPNNTPARAGDVDDSMFDLGDVFTREDVGTGVGLDYNTIPNSANPSGGGDIDDSMFDFDQGTDLGLDYNIIPNNTPAEAGDIDESMFDDPTGSAEPSPVLVQDEAGNFFLANADGSFSPADADGNAMGEPIFIGGNEVGDGTNYADSGYGDTALDTGGGYEAYDADGNLWHVNEDGSYDLVEPAYEEPSYYEEPPPYIEPDLSYLDDFTYEDPNYGYDFNYDPGYYEEPPAYYESDLSYLDDYKRGGQVQKMKKGGLPHFDEGGGADTNIISSNGWTGDSGGGEYYGDPTDYTDASVYPYVDDPRDYTDASVYPYVDDPTDYTSPLYNNNEGENVFDPYDLAADEELFEDELGQKWAKNSAGEYRLIEDAPAPAKPPENPLTPGFTTTNNGTTPTKTTSGSNFNYKDLFSTDNIKALAGAGLGAAGLMALYNSMKDKDSTYKAPVYKAPAIPARTTDFGMGPVKTVTPTMGGLQTMTPSQQEELYTNLGVPGYEMEHEDPVENQVEDQPMADGGYAQPNQPASPSYFTYGMPQDPLEVLGVRQPQPKTDGGGLQMRQGGLPHPVSGVPVVQGRHDYRQGAAVKGEGDGQSDDIPAMLADGEYVFDADVVAALGNGSNKAGAEVLDKFREEIRAHKRSAEVDKIPPKAKSPLAYLKEAQT